MPDRLQTRFNPHYPQFMPGYRIPGTRLTVRAVYGPRMSAECDCGWWASISCRKAAGPKPPYSCGVCKLHLRDSYAAQF